MYTVPGLQHKAASTTDESAGLDMVTAYDLKVGVQTATTTIQHAQWTRYTQLLSTGKPRQQSVAKYPAQSVHS